MEMTWDPNIDNPLAKLFQPLDLESVSLVEALAKLRDVERLVIRFESRIGGTDEGFALWGKLHQHAMEAGQSPEPGYPPLRRRDGTWDDDAWQGRYSYVVAKRTEFVAQRLVQVMG